MSLTDEQKSLLHKALATAQHPVDGPMLAIYLVHHTEWHRLKLALQFLDELHERMAAELEAARHVDEARARYMEAKGTANRDTQ